MGKKALVVCSAAIMGIVSTATGFAAEFTRVKASQVKIVDFFTECSHPQSPALGLGLIAAAALVIAHTIINFATGCFCCNKTSQTNNPNWPARVFYVLSWCTFLVGFILLLAASALKDRGDEQTVYNGNYYYYHYCYVIKPRVYAAGAVLATVSVILGILCYLSLNKEKKDAPLPNQSNGITTGQPQFPPKTSKNVACV